MPYTPNPQHRQAGFAQRKSQWLITVAEEGACYSLACQQNWMFNNSYWGLHISNPIQNPQILGVSPPPSSCNVQMAKFVGDHQGNWHGYPVAHWLSPFDKPGESVLRDWFNQGYISRSVFSKIHRGRKCAL